MILQYSLRSHTDTASLALASLTPTLLTRLSIVGICEELKLVAPLKTFVLPLPLFAQLTKTCSAHPHFLP